ncbi:DNA-binding protein [Limosilactobacillus fermentum]|uniref:helix-turn-helix domain-containing protein n=1 Tax=Limosilactobacillus fermentum TaxID=1613 RepID=UPI0010769262|nr:helix-turn-helix domain-containing protein [Limosilactobacillus fermentum]TFZ18981.1 DNA-binding protein [Limosilactobacillus fermentum]
MSEYLTYKEACEILHLKSYKGLYYLIKNGLPVIVIGNSKRINANDLKKFMEDHTVTATPKD